MHAALWRHAQEGQWPWGHGTPGSSALQNPHPKSPCVEEERRAGLGQTLSTGSPIEGSREPKRSYCGQHTFVQGAVPRAATADDSDSVKVSDGDGFLSRNVTIEANNKIVKRAQPTAGKKSEWSNLGPIMSLARLYFSLCIKTLTLHCMRTV